jgi:GH15 family glucan-1,4-alpha-glucosidase
LADAPIWEVRGGQVHHVHSKLMAWLALDRALRIDETHRLSARRRRRWKAAREAIRVEVRRLGFDSSMGSYTRSCGSRNCWTAPAPWACMPRS